MAKTKRAKSDVRADLRKLADLVQREVDAGADSVEEIHRSIAAMPLDVLEKLDVLESTVKDVRKAQAAAIGSIYKLIHKVNHEVGKLAQELLDGRATRSRAHGRTAAKKTAPRRTAARGGAAGSQFHAHV
jgi:hypothetical protein